MRTTCHNNKCPEYEKCDFNIHKGGKRPCPEGQHYKSMKQSIWEEYTKKCEESGIEPMPYNIFFEN